MAMPLALGVATCTVLCFLLCRLGRVDEPGLLGVAPYLPFPGAGVSSLRQRVVPSSVLYRAVSYPTMPRPRAGAD